MSDPESPPEKVQLVTNIETFLDSKSEKPASKVSPDSTEGNINNDASTSKAAQTRDLKKLPSAKRKASGPVGVGAQCRPKPLKSVEALMAQKKIYQRHLRQLQQTHLARQLLGEEI